MKTGFVAASALVGSVAAGAHNAHNPFHMRRGEYADNQICTVYTTVYVTALPSIVPNATEYVVPSPVPETSAPCTEEEYSTPAAVSSSIYVAPSPSSVYVAPSPPASILSWSKSAYVPAPSSSEKPYVPVPAPSSEKPYVPSVPAYTPSAPAYTPVVPKPSKPVESHKPKPSKPAHGGGQYGGNITPNGQKWAITYTPYAQNGDCKSAGEVQSDIAKIAGLGYTTIRSYSTDCGVFENVVPACQKHGLKIIYGIFLDASKGPNSEGANEQLEEIINKAPKDSIAMLVVGNEYIFGHGGSASELAPYVKSCKEKLVAAGFSSDIPVTTTEPVGTWEQYGEALCDVIDVFAVQVHPFFDGGISAEQAGDFAQKQLEQAAKVCPEAAARGKYITEIGWPKGGETNGAAVPSPSEQKKAIESIIESVGEVACIFSFQDDEWKDAGAFGVERNFGCADILP